MPDVTISMSHGDEIFMYGALKKQYIVVEEEMTLKIMWENISGETYVCVEHFQNIVYTVNIFNII